MPAPASRGFFDRALGATVTIAAFLVLPVSLLLFLQWPLRDVVQAYSREANDLAQILFALYVGVAITAATRADAHLAADGVARALSLRTRRALARVAALAVQAPWAAFVLWSGWPSLVQSVRQLEAFPDTFNPGYFVIRIALALLALLVLIQALRDSFAPPSESA
jgi:TRAP-type C4-dicarboxylate transport system permease small subunit